MILLTTPIDAPLRGTLQPAGDKSISHRALIMATLASGQSRIADLLDSEDVHATASACRQLGAHIENEDGDLRVTGTGESGLSAPAGVLDMGNSGTAMRLFAGVLAAQDFNSELIGDESLSRRPMRRIVEPLTRMGARIETTDSGTSPLRITGRPGLQGLDFDLPVASAQVKSCLLLAGLYATGITRVAEPQLSRDHTERMLPVFGVPLQPGCGVQGGSRLTAADIRVPADISSAAFFICAAAMIPGSDVTLRNVGINPSRDGILRFMQAAGADMEALNCRMFGQEPVADIRVRYSEDIHGADIPEEWIPSLIDELPIIMAMAAVIPGTTRIRGAAELRVKESDRLAVMAQGLGRMGVALQEYEDGIDIDGGRLSIPQDELNDGAHVDGAGDHRCAMSFCILGQLAPAGLKVGGCSHIGTSYPGFTRHLQQLGGQVAPAGGGHD